MVSDPIGAEGANVARSADPVAGEAGGRDDPFSPDVRTDRWTDGRKDERTDGRTEPYHPSHLQP